MEGLDLLLQKGGMMLQTQRQFGGVRWPEGQCSSHRDGQQQRLQEQSVLDEGFQRSRWPLMPA